MCKLCIFFLQLQEIQIRWFANTATRPAVDPMMIQLLRKEISRETRKHQAHDHDEDDDDGKFMHVPFHYAYVYIFHSYVVETDRTRRGRREESWSNSQEQQKVLKHKCRWSTFSYS